MKRLKIKFIRWWRNLHADKDFPATDNHLLGASIFRRALRERSAELILMPVANKRIIKVTYIKNKSYICRNLKLKVMKIEFEGVAKHNGEVIKSNCIIQKEMMDGLHILLSVNGRWARIYNESLKIKML